ncbi:unnamed protein product [Rotaria socialis]|uniref:Uncharacterized protein n=1 Tax=Rotaria socialis TaxID=392032 RepID=A0A817SDE0_9BILA|nr:unnamed protein product [Rotaria socialis]CAF4527433.1 unnamed protein product [Rotaria socialis]
MQNVKSYFSSWKTFWKSSTNSYQSRTLSLAPSTINFTNSSLGDLKDSTIDEKLMIDISTKLMNSTSPPKLQICAHNNQWFALNNSHLLVYRQLERIGLCDTVVCDVIRSEDIPLGIRESLVPVVKRQQKPDSCCQNSREHMEDQNVLMDDEGQDEIMYFSDVQADSCGCLEGEDQCDSSNITYGDSDRDGDSDDEQTSWPTKTFSLTRLSTIGNSRFDDIDLDDDGTEDHQKEMQSLL